MSINIVVSIITLFLTAVISFLVLAQDKKNKANISFFLFGLSAILWILSNILADLSKNIFSAVFWCNITIIWPVFFPPLFFYLINQIYKNQRIKYKKIFFLFLVIGSPIIFLSQSSLNVEYINIHDWGVGYTPGPLYYLLFLYLLIGFGISFYYLIKFYKLSVEPQSSQIKFIFTGLFLTVLFSVMASIIAPLIGYGEASVFGPPSILFFLFFTAFAILKHHLFDIKIITTELLIFAIWGILLAQIALADSLRSQFINGCLLILVIFFGLLLIKSTLDEVKRKEEAERLLKAKTEFLSIASHQLRTPLTAIIGYSSMLNEGDYGAIPERAKKAISRIYDSSQRMIKLVNDFLSVSRMETGKTTLKLQETSISELIREVISGLELRAKEKNLYLKYQEPADYYLKTDPAKIKEAVSNFIDNAIHYTEEGGITVSVQKNNLKTVISVSDTGAGMDTEELAKLFESFSRGSAGNELNTQGSGLGLYIAKKFVELHNGKVWAKSEGKGKGSTFCIELPNK